MDFSEKAARDVVEALIKRNREYREAIEQIKQYALEGYTDEIIGRCDSLLTRYKDRANGNV